MLIYYHNLLTILNKAFGPTCSKREYNYHILRKIANSFSSLHFNEKIPTRRNLIVQAGELEVKKPIDEGPRFPVFGAPRPLFDTEFRSPSAASLIPVGWGKRKKHQLEILQDWQEPDSGDEHSCEHANTRGPGGKLS